MSQAIRMVVALAVVCSLLALLVIMIGGCSSSSGPDSAAPLSVAITDDTGVFAEVHLSVAAVRVVQTGREEAPTGPGLPLIAGFDPARSVDVLNLAYKQELLGTAQVPVGTYQQVRLVLAPNQAGQPPANYVTLTEDPDTEIALDTPSGQTAGLKVVGRFEVQPGVANAIVLDFDPARAIVEAGVTDRYLLKPTGIRIVQVDQVVQFYGSLSLAVEPEEAWADATVLVTPLGGTDPIAMGTVSPDDGSFRAFVPAGQYSVRVVAAGYETYDTALLDPPVHYEVVVGANTELGLVMLQAQ
jgi:hypothetical protein